MSQTMDINNRIVSLFFFLCLEYASLISCSNDKIEVTAFEYRRKFGTTLDVGQCALHMEEISPGKSITKGCSLPRKQGNIRKINRPLNDTRNFEIRQFNDIFVFMGLCSAKAASTLGLLLNGDCFAVEIASNLTFNKKTYIRAYVEYYRKAIDIQQDTSYYQISPDRMDDYDGSYYLRDRSYGILEIIIVEMKFYRKKDVDLLKNMAARLESNQMSTHMNLALSEVGKPFATKVMRVSTSENSFEMNSYRKPEFDEALREVRRYEMDLFRIRFKMEHESPHLNYGMLPYIPKPRALSLRSGKTLRGDHMLSWETATGIEISINRALLLYKKMKRQCNRAKLPDCSHLLTVKRELKNMKTIVHEKRSKWTYLSEEDQTNTNKIYGARLRRSKKELSKTRRKLKKWRVSQKKSGKWLTRKNKSGRKAKLRALKKDRKRKS